MVNVIRALFETLLHDQWECGCALCVECKGLKSLDGDGLDNWGSLFELFSNDSDCFLLRKLSRILYGSIITVSFCVHCQRDGNFRTASVEVVPIKGAIDYDLFRFDLNSSKLCKTHNCPTVALRCFGDVPCVGLVTATSTGRTLYAMPLMIFDSESDKEWITSIDPAETLLGKSLFVGNPCYIGAHQGLKASILAGFPGCKSYLVRFRSHPKPQSEWNLCEVRLGLPFARKNFGKQRILDSVYGMYTSLDGQPLLCFPPFHEKEKTCTILYDDLYELSSDEGTDLNTEHGKEIRSNSHEDSIPEVKSMFTQQPGSLSPYVKKGKKLFLPLTDKGEPLGEADTDLNSEHGKEIPSNCDEESIFEVKPMFTEHPGSLSPHVKKANLLFPLPDGDELLDEADAEVNTEHGNEIRSSCREGLTPEAKSTFNEDLKVGHSDEEDVMENSESKPPYSPAQPARIPTESFNEEDPISSSEVNSEHRNILGYPGYQRDWHGEYHVPLGAISDLDADKECIPFLYASFPLLKRVEHVQNDHYYTKCDGGLTMDQAVEEYQSSIDSILVDGCSIESLEKQKVAYHKSSVLPSSAGMSLTLVVDIDSIDFITVPWGGNAFRAPCKIFLRYENRYQEHPSYLTPNNNLVKFPSNCSRVTEKYFLDKRYKRFEKRSGQDGNYRRPIAFKVLEIRTSLSYDPIMIRAIIPERMVLKSLSGHEALLMLFQQKIAPDAREGYNPCPIMHKFFWYLVSEVFLFITRLCTRSGNYALTTSRQICCAVPDAKNGFNHDRSNGFGSSYGEGLVLDEIEIIVVQLMVSRFLAWVEQVAEVPDYIRIFDKYRSERYECPDHVLHNIEDQAIRDCLKAEVYSAVCLEYFERVLSDENMYLGNLLKLKSDPTRRGENALPHSRSNRKALELGRMCLEDLLLLCPMELRCTGHGFKKRLMTKAKLVSTRERLSNELHVRGIEDGVLDIGLTLQGPLGYSYALNLSSSSTRHSKLFVPAIRSKNTMKQLNGLLYSSAGYPEFFGFSTEKGFVNRLSTALCAGGIRRVKVYSTKRRTEASRGSTVYESSGRKLYSFLVDSSDSLRNWCGCEAERPTQTRSECIAREKEVDSLFGRLIHDIERRTGTVKSVADGIGVRVELTYALEGSWGAFNAAIYLLGLQEERKEMDISTFQEEKRTNPEKWPWWLDLPHQSNETEEISKSHLLPVTILNSEQFLHFNLSVEGHLVRSAFNIYRQCHHVITKESLAAGDQNSAFFQDVLNRATPNIISLLTMVTVRGLLSAARVMIVAYHCKRHNACLVDSSPLLTALGLDFTLLAQGIPRIVLPRLLSLHDSLRTFFLNQSWIPSSEVLLAVRNDDRMLDEIVNELDEDIDLAKSMDFRYQQRKPSFMSVVLGTRTANVTDSSRRQFNRVQDIVQEIVMRSVTGWGLEDVFLQLAVIVTRFLVSDIFLELDLMLGVRSMTLETSFHNSRMYPEITMESVENLTRMVRSGSLLPEEALFSQLLYQRRTVFRDELHDLLSYYRRGVFLHILGNYSGGDDEDQSIPHISVDGFIQSLWKHSSILPHYSEFQVTDLMLQSGAHLKNSFHKWRSVIALKVIEHEFVTLEEYYQQNQRMGTTRTNRMEFYDKFPISLGTCLQAFGFFRICPSIIENPLPAKDRSQMRVWGPQPVFGRLQSCEVFHPLQPSERQLSFPTAPRSSAETGLQWEQNVSCLRANHLDSLSNFLKEVSASPSTEVERSETCRCDQLDGVSKRLWRRAPELLDLIMEMFSSRHEHIDLEKNLSPYSLDWARRVLEFLLQMRSNMVDEGYAVYQVEGNADSLSNRRSLEHTSQLRTIYKSEREIAKHPWQALNYPSPKYTREGKVTKQISIRQASTLLWSTNLVLKTDCSTFPSKPRNKKPLEFHKYSGRSVREVYWEHRLMNAAVACSSHAMWRLAPDGVILSVLLDYLKDKNSE